MTLLNHGEADGAVAAPSAALLSAARLTKSFGGLAALRDVSFDVPAGSVTALIGPNGAGKTTLFNMLTGFDRPDSGQVFFAGRRVDGTAPHRIVRLGMARTFQSIRMLKGLSVYESLLVAHRRAGSPASRATDAIEMLDRLQLADLADRPCQDLPLLAQRRLEVARALMTRPRMLLLDEPSAGATPGQRRSLIELIAELRRSGTTVVVIEHNVPFVLEVSDRIVVLNFGEKVADGPAADVAADPVVQRIYLGHPR
jgi:ABC-type branched-subunit amino acid transport system ATPase component